MLPARRGKLFLLRAVKEEGKKVKWLLIKFSSRDDFLLPKPVRRKRWIELSRRQKKERNGHDGSDV